jgi:membrane fusion protein, multidrug efflux system
MKKWIGTIFAGLLIAGLLPVSHHGLGAARLFAAEEATQGPVAAVQTLPLKRGTIAELTVVYGQVIAAPGALRTVSVPFESRILGVRVNEGQKVSKGDILLKMQPSPDATLALHQAANAFALAGQNYRQVRLRRQHKLATNEQVLQAKEALDQARLRLESMKGRGIDGTRDIRSHGGGLVKKIYVQEGAIVPAGQPVMDIVAQHRVEVLLGVEPETIAKVHPGQKVRLSRISVPAFPAVDGKVRKISYAVNPNTRLVDVFVSPSSQAGLLLGESIEGRIITASAEGLIVPRSAVLTEGAQHLLFTVRDGHAVAHEVTLGIENAEAYQVTGKGLAAGQPVVVSGNYELTDGMAVRVEAAK